MCLKLRSEVDPGALWVPPSSGLSKLQSLEEHHSVLPRQPSAGAHKSPLSLAPSRSRPAIPGKAVPAQHGKPEVVLFCPAMPALGPRSSMQHKAAAVQERIWLRDLRQECTLNSFWEHQAQTDEVVFTRTQASIYLVLCRLSLSQAPASQLPVSSSRRENTGAEAKDSWVSVRLLVLIHCLALLGHLTSLLLVPLLKKDKEAGFDWARQLSPGNKRGLFWRAEAALSPEQPALNRGRAKYKGQSQTVTCSIPLLLFNLWKLFAQAPVAQVPVAGIM